MLSGLGALPPMYEGTVPQYDITDLPDQYDVYSNMVGADKYPVLALYNEWCDVASMYQAILTGDPYPIRVGINEAGSFMNEPASLMPTRMGYGSPVRMAWYMLATSHHSLYRASTGYLSAPTILEYTSY